MKGTLVVDTPQDYEAWLKERAELAGGPKALRRRAAPQPENKPPRACSVADSLAVAASLCEAVAAKKYIDEIRAISRLSFSELVLQDRGTWFNRFAWFICVAALFLICSGGMVTSKDVGLAVPDWPTTFGYNMFLFPVSKWVGGIFFEHTHRLIASAVGFLTIILAIWLWRSESRGWIRISAGFAWPV